jgi:hypothetical protein
MMKHLAISALALTCCAFLLLGCATEKAPYQPEKYQQWIAKVDRQLKQAAQNNTASAQWTDAEDFSKPSVMIDIRGFTEEDARGLADMIAGEFFNDFPKEERVFIHVYDAHSRKEIFFDMYDRSG